MTAAGSPLQRRVEWLQARCSSADALADALASSGFERLETEPGAAVITLVHRASLTVVELLADGSGAAVIEGEDARVYLTDVLTHQSGGVAGVIDLLGRIGGGPPIVLEAFRRGRRLLLAKLPRVVEVRGRRATVDRVRILDEPSSAVVIDAVLRLRPTLDALRATLSDVHPLVSRPRSWLALGRRAVVVEVVGGGGFRLASADERDGILLGAARSAGDIDAVDALVARWCEIYGRRETADPRGQPTVVWRLDPLPLELVARETHGVLHFLLHRV